MSETPSPTKYCKMDDVLADTAQPVPNLLNIRRIKKKATDGRPYIIELQ